MARQSEQLERETEQSRAELAHSLDELRERMRPGRMLDDVLDYAREGDVAAMADNLRRQVVGNPLALGLIGAGLAWLMVPNRVKRNGRIQAERMGARMGASLSAARNDMADSTRDLADSTRDLAEAGREWGRETSDVLGSAVDEVGDSASAGLESGRESVDASRASLNETGRRFGSRLSGGVNAMRDAMSDGTDAIRDRATDASRRVSQAGRDVSSAAGRFADAASDTARRGREQASAFGHGVARTASGARDNFMTVVREQPLIVAGVGLAIGAAIGAMLPRTETEDEWMGETSDDFAAAAEQAANRQVDTAKHAAQEAFTEMKHTAEGAADEMKEEARRAVEEVRNEAAETADEWRLSRGKSDGSSPSVVPEQPASSTQQRTPGTLSEAYSNSDR